MKKRDDEIAAKAAEEAAAAAAPPAEPTAEGEEVRIFETKITSSLRSSSPRSSLTPPPFFTI